MENNKADMIEEAEKRYPLDPDFTRNELLNVNAVRDGYRKAYIAGRTVGSDELEKLKDLLRQVVTREYSECRQTDKNKNEVWNNFKIKHGIE